MIELPIIDTPWIKAYQIRNFELGILQDKTPWILSKYINCTYTAKAEAMFDHCISAYGRFFFKEKALLMQRFKFNKSIFSFKAMDFVKWAKSLLDQEWYLMGYLDEYYVKSKQAYNKYHFRHSMMIYGYDEIGKVFYAIGYTNENKYSKYSISFEEFLKSVQVEYDSVKKDYIPRDIERVEFDAVKINPEHNFEFDLKEVYLGIKDYINSTDSYDTNNSNYLYGIECERKFVEYIQNSIEKEDAYLDVRYSRLFMEMKDIMIRRLEYLVSIGVISNELLEEYRTISKKQTYIHLAFIKYNLKHNDDTLKYAVSALQTIIESELNLLPQICSQILSALQANKKGEYL